MTLLIGEPTATVEGWTQEQTGTAKKIVPVFMLECLESGELEELRFYSKVIAATSKVVLGIYADNGSGTAPTGAALGEATFTGATEANKWHAATGLKVKLTKGTKYWLALDAVGANAKIALSHSAGAGTLVVKNSTAIENLKGASETWIEASKNGPAGIQGNGTVEAGEQKGTGVGKVSAGAQTSATGTRSATGSGSVKAGAVTTATGSATSAGSGKGKVSAGGVTSAQGTRSAVGIGRVTAGASTKAEGSGAAPPTKKVPYGADPLQIMDIYKATVAGSPVVVLVHGGGWVGGTNSGINNVAKALQLAGFAVFNIEYRRASLAEHIEAFPMEIEDTELATQYAISHAATYNGTASKLYMVSGSAGGQLACMATLALNAAKPQTVKKVVGLSIATNLWELVLENHGFGPDLAEALGAENLQPQCETPEKEALAKLNSPALHLLASSQAVHWWLSESEESELMPKGQFTGMKAALESLGAPLSTKLVPGKEHSYSYWATVEAEVIAFLQSESSGGSGVVTGGAKTNATGAKSAHGTGLVSAGAVTSALGKATIAGQGKGNVTAGARSSAVGFKSATRKGFVSAGAISSATGTGVAVIHVAKITATSSPAARVAITSQPAATITIASEV